MFISAPPSPNLFSLLLVSVGLGFYLLEGGVKSSSRSYQMGGSDWLLDQSRVEPSSLLVKHKLIFELSEIG